MIKMFNRHILALKMNYNVFTRFGKLQKPNWDWVYKLLKIVKPTRVTYSYLVSYTKNLIFKI